MPGELGPYLATLEKLLADAYNDGYARGYDEGYCCGTSYRPPKKEPQPHSAIGVNDDACV